MEVEVSSYEKEPGRFPGHKRTLRMAVALQRLLERETPTINGRQQGLDVLYCAL